VCVCVCVCIRYKNDTRRKIKSFDIFKLGSWQRRGGWGWGLCTLEGVDHVDGDGGEELVHGQLGGDGRARVGRGAQGARQKQRLGARGVLRVVVRRHRRVAVVAVAARRTPVVGAHAVRRDHRRQFLQQDLLLLLLLLLRTT
jgi:hypothetical protein